MTWGGIGEIFNPGERHASEELQRKRVEAKIPGREGDPNRVDLDSGVVHITLAPPVAAAPGEEGESQAHGVDAGAQDG
jgi:Family of unknown function (DUF6191)